MKATNAVIRAWLLILAVFTLAACGDSSQPKLTPLSDDAVILAFGDSLTYGTGANPQTESYPAVLEELSGKTVINAGVPGEISKEGLARITDLLIQHKPALVLLCHGGNDLIRKLDEQQLSKNLALMVALIKQHSAEVVLLSVPKPGVFLKPAPLYEHLAQNLDLPLENDVIAEVESKTSLKSDAIHPNAEGYRIIAERVQGLLQDTGAL